MEWHSLLTLSYLSGTIPMPVSIMTGAAERTLAIVVLNGILFIGRGGNEQKFLGEGQMFKGKLIGVLEVQEARGDRMCQDALQELKTAIKASGEHKQRILIHIAVDGLKIRDEKTGVIWSLIPCTLFEKVQFSSDLIE